MKPQNTEENKSRCLCEGCPLFGACNQNKKEKFFCGTKKSECDMDSNKMCICGGCPVYRENDLAGGYFCINELGEK